MQPPAPYRAPVDAAPRVEDLGAFEREYCLSPGWNRGLIAAAIALPGVGLALLAFMTSGFRADNRVSFASSTEQWAVSLVMTLVIAVPGALAFRIWLVERAIRVRLYDQGFTDQRARLEIVPFDHVERLYVSERITNGIALYRYRIETRTGRRLMLSRQLHVRDLRIRIEHELARRKLPELRAAIERGGIASFGAITLTREGLTYRGRTRAWSEIDAVRIDGLVVGVSTNDRRLPWFRAPTGGIPNLAILVALLEPLARVYR